MVIGIEAWAEKTLPQFCTESCAVRGAVWLRWSHLTPAGWIGRKWHKNTKTRACSGKIEVITPSILKERARMAIIPQMQLFSWEAVQPLGDLERL